MRAGLDIVGLVVLDESGQRKGTVTDVLFDDSSRRMIGVMVERGWLRRRHEFISFERIRSIGPDSLVAGAGRPCTEFEGRGNALQGKLVVSRGGHCLGRVDDVYIEERTGDVKAYRVASEFRGAGPPRRLLLPFDSRPTIGDVVVIDDPSALKRSSEYPRLA